MTRSVKSFVCIGFAVILTLGGLGNSAIAEDRDTGDSDEEGPCYDVPEYDGINAIPAMTMQVHPSSGGDTVVNDAEYPPGPGPQIVVGFWEHPEDYEPDENDKNPNPCAGEPVMKIAYPLNYGSQKCFGWKHWAPPGDDLHENSAKNFSCDAGVFNYTQWTTMTCEGTAMNAGTDKSASRRKCCRDKPPTLYSQILSGCGKKPPHGK